MQVQIKKQLKIELDEQDIISAVGEYLKANDVKVTDEDLTKINFVKSPKDGLRATLNVTEAETIEDEPSTSRTVEAQVAETAPQETATDVADEEEEPGVIATSTVEDVMPSVDEAIKMAAQQDAEAESAVEAEAEAPSVPAAESEAPRKSLFL